MNMTTQGRPLAPWIKTGDAPRRTLRRWEEEGRIVRVRRGLFRRADAPRSEHHDLVIVGRAVPEGIVCLLSAAAVHDLTTVVPPEIMVAVPREAWIPRISHPPVRFFRWTLRQLKAGVVRRRMEGAVVAMTDPEKTVCDCLRHMDVVGREAAMEVLRTWLRRPGRSLDRLLAAAGPARVEKRLRAYLEALL
jgi:predicted transcriptional regulator of viral defense system